ncbi:GTPBP8 [Symbiodinium sp. CCMP2592]|nr:GTPBP8 [Symbiodinium sp. CCMP2592]
MPENTSCSSVSSQSFRGRKDWGGWDEAGWSADPAASAGSLEAIPLPGFFRMRRAQAEPPKAIKEFIALHQLGNVKLPKLKRGEHRPAIFAGSDPAHDGRRGAVDDGRGDTLGRMATAVHKGFLRQRARCHPGLQTSSAPLPERPEVAFIGASNVGKSSLLNSLTRTQQLAPAKEALEPILILLGAAAQQEQAQLRRAGLSATIALQTLSNACISQKLTWACDDASLLQRTASAPAGLLQAEELPSVASITFAPGSEWMMGWRRKSPSALQVEKSEPEPEILRMERKASLLDAPVIRTLSGRTSEPSGPPPSTHPDSDAESSAEFFGLETPGPAGPAGGHGGGLPTSPKLTPNVRKEEPERPERERPEPRRMAAELPPPPLPPAQEPKAETEPKEPKAKGEPAEPEAPAAPAVETASSAPAAVETPAPTRNAAAEEAASWIDIMIPGAQTVLHVKNPEEIEATSSDPNPQVATFRTNNVTVEAVPLVPNERLSVSQTLKGNRTLLVEALEALQEAGAGSGRPFDVATAALAAMERALSEATLTSRDIEEADVREKAALDKSESLEEKAAELSKTLEDIADGVAEASAQQVAKGAEEALRLRGLWQEDVNGSLLAEQEKREQITRLAQQLSTVARSGVTALKAVTLGLHLEVNLTAAAASFRRRFALSNESSGSLWQLPEAEELATVGKVPVAELQRYKEVLLGKLKDLRILPPPVGSAPLTAEIASKDGPKVTLELLTKNETASDFKTLQEDLKLASRQLQNATSHVQEMSKEVEAADAAARSLDLVAARKQNLTQELLGIVEATEKLSKGISDFPQAEAGEAISVATSVANRSAALEEGASKARRVAALLRSAELDFEESLNRSTEATARLANAGEDAQSQLLQALKAAASGLRLANASGAKVDFSGLLELFGKGTLGVAGQDLVPVFQARAQVNVTTSREQAIANLPYDRFFAPASTSTKAEETEAEEEVKEAVLLPSTSSRPKTRELEEENWMPGPNSGGRCGAMRSSERMRPKAVLFSMACVLSLLVADDPGVTRSIDWYKCSRLPLDVIDLPGYGYAKGAEFGPLVADFVQSRKSLRVLYCLVDARTGIRPTDWRFYASLGNRGGPEKAPPPGAPPSRPCVAVRCVAAAAAAAVGAKGVYKGLLEALLSRLGSRRKRTKDSEPERGAMATRKATPGPGGNSGREAQARSPQSPKDPMCRDGCCSF